MSYSSLLFRWFCGFEKPLIYVTKDMKFIVESVHLILTLFNWSDKLLLESRQCNIFLEISNVCHYASKGILFLVLLAEFSLPFTDSSSLFMEWPLCASGHWACSGGWGRAMEHRSFPHGAPILRDERAEVVWKENCTFWGITLFFLCLQEWKWSKL